MTLLSSKPHYRASNAAIAGAKRKPRQFDSEILAFSRKDDSLSHTIYLPRLPEKKLRHLVGITGPMIGSRPLSLKQLKKLQQVVEIQFQPDKFDYQFDADCVARQREASKAVQYWREVDATLRAALLTVADAPKSSRTALDKAYQRLTFLINRAHRSSS